MLPPSYQEPSWRPYLPTLLFNVDQDLGLFPKKTADSTQRKKWVSISAPLKMSRKRIGELLLEKGAITRPQLDACLATQKQTHQRLGVLLVQKGYVTEAALSSALSSCNVWSMPRLPSQRTLPTTLLSQLLSSLQSMRLLPRRLFPMPCRW